MIRVTIFIPISRPDHLDRLFASLELLDCDAETTALLVYVDGDHNLRERVRRFVVSSKFSIKLCHARKDQSRPSHGLLERRKRIAAIKNESKELLPDCQYVFGIEDDTIVPPHALAQLLDDHTAHPHAGLITGVELGRWGIPHVGAWRADDVYEPTTITSVMPGSHLEEIDAAGFYCYLTRRWLYVLPEYAPFGKNDLGPDVAYGLFLRQQGFHNYVDWRVSCEHRKRIGKGITPQNTTPRQVALVKRDGAWHQKLS